MILVPGKLLFVHIQKTGGTSITKLIIENFGDWQVIGRKHSRMSFTKLKRDELFSFTFVRNPWDRMVSWYNMIINGSMRIPWHIYVRREGRTFEEFVCKCITSGRADRTGIFQLRKIVDNQGSILVDFVGRFERFTDDVLEVFSRMEVSINRSDIPHLLRNGHGHYSKYYNSDTQKIVGKVFGDEIEFFGYQFEGMG